MTSKVLPYIAAVLVSTSSCFPRGTEQCRFLKTYRAAVQCLDGNDGGFLGHSERPAGRAARDVRPVSVVVAVARAVHRVEAPLGPTLEVLVRDAHARVDDVHELSFARALVVHVLVAARLPVRDVAQTPRGGALRDQTCLTSWTRKMTLVSARVMKELMVMVVNYRPGWLPIWLRLNPPRQG